jgi:hypothetical protein
MSTWQSLTAAETNRTVTNASYFSAGPGAREGPVQVKTIYQPNPLSVPLAEGGRIIQRRVSTAGDRAQQAGSARWAREQTMHSATYTPTEDA